MTTPNSTLRAVRMGLLLSQDEFARAIREAGTRAGQRNDASKRLVQRWEAGIIAAPRPLYARALEAVTGLPVEALGFAAAPMARVSEDGRGGHDLKDSSVGIPEANGTPTPQAAPRGNYSGVWLSTYEFVSSGRNNEVFTGKHFVVLLQHGNRLTARSLPNASLNPDSPLTLDLQIDGSAVTGTWTEQTASDGYYRGARYFGALQMLVDPTGRRMSGKWCGFGKEFDVNTGPWELRLMDSSTSKATLAAYDRAPDAS
ncbi:helix-turn-helix transcriptional regulator [Streptomyces sp. Je 1-369]|uniref:helix-turn-helix transcriptional regulator n=1 Tax=Streptomyces sp. Je 1-369 TaxID=2966192 RepID=UPI002285460B|nr:helix-turn-helix transcriptional regulator [Streptomyces sp. Je 1-369]WAL98112.1 helix-turn-helix domain-containing protein [Streptomyces sp. Je 1-369]